MNDKRGFIVDNDVDYFIKSEEDRNRLLNGRFAYIEFDRRLLANVKPIPIFLKNKNKDEETLENTLKNNPGNFMFIGEGGIGKTTSLLWIWDDLLKKGTELPIFVPLNEYNEKRPSNFITNYIKDNYKLDLSTTDQKVILLLDGLNEVFSNDTKHVLQEIGDLLLRENTRFAVTSRYRIVDIVFETFAQFDIQPLSPKTIIDFLKDAGSDINSLPNDWKELLATPMMLALYANTCAMQKGACLHELFKASFKIDPHTNAEIIYNYLLCQLSKLYCEESEHPEVFQTAYVSLFWVAPYIAWKMEHEEMFDMDIDKCNRETARYLNQYSQFIQTSADRFFVGDLIDCTPIIENAKKHLLILVKEYCLITKEGRKYIFRHQHFRDFLSALHIDNAVARELENQKTFIIPIEIKNRLLPPQIAKMLGDYYGDYENQNGTSILTRLHELLERLRGVDHKIYGYAVNNIISIWRISRRNHLVGENLQDLDFSIVPLNGVFFFNQHDTSTFEGCTISETTFLPQGHSSVVDAAVYSHTRDKDGERWVFSASYDNTIRGWDRKTGKCLRIFEGHSGPVNCIVCSNDDRQILSASWDGTIREWDRETGECLRIYEGHSAQINSAIYSHDGQRILSVSWDGTIREWNRETRECLKVYEGHTNYVNSAVYSHSKDNNEKWILSASDDGTIREWDRETKECLHVYEGHSDFVKSVQYSQDNQRILSASNDNTIREWDRETKECLRTYEGHDLCVNNAIYNYDEKRILSASDDGTIREWDRETKQPMHIFEGQCGNVNNATYNHDEKRILSASDDGTIREWDIETGQCLHIYDGYSSVVHSAVYNCDEERILSASYDNTVREWDKHNNRCLRIFDGHSGVVKMAVYSHDNKRILSASDDGTIREWDRETGECLRIYEGHSQPVSSAVYSQDEKRILSASYDDTIREWDRETGECLRIYEGHSAQIDSAVYSHDDKRILSASYDKTIREWDRESRECLRIYEGHKRAVKKVVYSHDDKRILSASYDDTICEWDRESKECLRTLRVHGRSVKSALYSHDEKKILSASWDGTIRESDRETGQCQWVSSPYGGIFFMGCSFKKCIFSNKEIQDLIQMYGGIL